MKDIRPKAAAYFAILWFGTVIMIGGCGRGQNVDTVPQMRIVPGRGILNELEVGMSLEQISKNRPDFIVAAKRAKPGAEPFGFSGAIAALGIYVNVVDVKAPVGTIDFIVDPKSSSNRFYGSLNGFSFARGHRVVRSEIVDKFGTPSRFSLAETEIARKRLLAGQDVALTTGSDSEMLYYPGKGVMFDVRDGVVVRLSIIALSTNIDAGNK
jgi:hypothetical protein